MSTVEAWLPFLNTHLSIIALLAPFKIITIDSDTKLRESIFDLFNYPDQKWPFEGVLDSGLSGDLLITTIFLSLSAFLSFVTYFIRFLEWSDVWYGSLLFCQFGLLIGVFTMIAISNDDWTKAFKFLLPGAESTDSIIFTTWIVMVQALIVMWSMGTRGYFDYIRLKVNLKV